MTNSLYNPMTVIGKTAKPFEHPYKGTVVEVDSDPQQMGRIKVSIPELYGDYQEGIEGILPWIYPRYFGKFNNKFELDVPEKGTVVEVEFPYKNVYLGYYTNKPIFKSVYDDLVAIDADLGKSIKEIFTKEHYPFVYGKFDKNLTGWYVDKVTDEICIIQGTTKASIKLNTEGSLLINVPKNIIITAGEDIELNSKNLKFTTTYCSLEATTLDIKATTSQTGDLSLVGEITTTGDVQANGISLTGHTHTVPQSPSGTQESQPPTR